MAAKPSTAARKPTNNAPRLRILLGEAIAVGPGKADLLAAIAAEGSISAAARTMGMSYRRAWLLVDELNRVFVGPVVVSETGGRRGGGAVLTALGQDILRRYRAMEQRAAASVADDIRAFRALLHEKANF
ncbi:MAG: LysR family transcriptional regulator [Magnetospirillum sp.]|jgi:molybdate transport system regulatory protein|nr:LysR family transcriptional regulator [Magnetospirillum sp.]